MKVLLTRFGGIGDSFPVISTAKYLADQGNEVTVALRDDGDKTKQSNLFSNLTDFKMLDIKQIGAWNDRCVKSGDGYISIESIYPQFDRVIDFMNVVENNSTSPTNNYKDLWEHWQRSRNSNYSNWYDLHLAWAGVDPTKVNDAYKVPYLSMVEAEYIKASEFKEKHGDVFVIHPFASSLARSWYQAKDLVPKLLKEYPDCKIAFWNPQYSAWDLLSKKGASKLEKLHDNPLRETMILIAASKLVVSVDTGCAHIAEGLHKKSLVIYSTVPAWTRNKYYAHQTHIDPGETNPEFYTFSLSLGDPLRVKEGMTGLSERENKILSLWETNAEVSEAMEVLNTDAQGAELELKLIMGKKQSWERQQSKALSGVSVDVVFDKIKELL